MLTDDEITAIANDVRTLPLAEVGRHVMPLIHHIQAVEDRQCSGCRHWVAYNAGAGIAARGECLVYAADGAAVRVTAVGEQVDAVALLTPFDWQCKGWERRQPDTCEAQARIG